MPSLKCVHIMIIQYIFLKITHRSFKAVSPFGDSMH